MTWVEQDRTIGREFATGGASPQLEQDGGAGGGTVGGSGGGGDSASSRPLANRPAIGAAPSLEAVTPAPRTPPSHDLRAGRGPSAAAALQPASGTPAPAAAPASKPALVPASAPDEPRRLQSFADVVALAGEQRELLLQGHLRGSVRLVKFESGNIALALEPHAPADLPQRLSRFLNSMTQSTWMVTLSSEGGEPSLHQQAQAADAALRQQALRHPTIAAVMTAFPGAAIVSITPLNPSETSGETADEEFAEVEPFDPPVWHNMMCIVASPCYHRCGIIRH